MSQQLLDGGNQLSDAFEVACEQFFPDIYTADEEMKKVMRKPKTIASSVSRKRLWMRACHRFRRHLS